MWEKKDLYNKSIYNLKNVRIKYDFPLTYICSLYNLYPNKEDRMFSFNDIIADYDVPIILKVKILPYARLEIMTPTGHQE